MIALLSTVVAILIGLSLVALIAIWMAPIDKDHVLDNRS